MRFIWPAFALSLIVPVTSLAQNSVTFTIDPTAQVHPISRWIYGVNRKLGGDWANLTFVRAGGNRWSAYNWTNNASNAGSDWHFQNDDFLGGGEEPGGAVIPILRNAYDNNAGALITVQMVGYVSADKDPPGDVHNSGPDYLQKRFRPEAPKKNAPFTLTPNPNSPVVYMDEFVNWIKVKFPYGQTDPLRPIWFDLDNEPGVWAETHAEVHPQKPTYAEMAKKTTDYASAIKDVEPDALVFGGVTYGWGEDVDLQHAPDANGRDYLDFFLQQMSIADRSAGRRLVDVLDLHWYPEATGGGIRITDQRATPQLVAARLQTPRSLWDPDYVETSWVTRDSLHGPISLLPRLKNKIDREYPGTKLSFSEYNYGGGSDISGAIAEADVLGIFGKWGVFAACEWPGADQEPFIAGAFAMYRNFDGKMRTFGDTSISAETSDSVNSSVYASVDSRNPSEITLIAINKSDQPTTATFNFKNAPPIASGEVYQLTSVGSKPVNAGRVALANPSQSQWTLPPYSISTIRFTSGP